jgi:CMP/dCMP kinase
MRIAISGTAGSGKSTTAKLLAKKLKYRHYSMGDFQREIAKEKGVSITELGELEKKDPSIDKMVDEKQKALGKKDNFVIDSWLSPLFIPDSFKIFMDADLKVRTERIYKREPKDYKDLKDAEKKIELREKTNRDRWLRFYNYDFRDKRNYDLCIDTTNTKTDDVLNLVYGKVKDAKKDKHHPFN